MVTCEKLNPAIFIVGMPGSGKSLVSSYLREKGWSIIRFGEITIEEIKKRGLEVNESNERLIREELRRVNGKDIYAKLLIPKILDSVKKNSTGLDGLYSWSEYKFLKDNLPFNISIIAVFTPKKLRYERLSKRIIRPLTFKEAETRDFSEIENLEKGGPIAIADYTIINSNTIANLYKNTDEVIKKFLKNNSKVDLY